MATAAAPPPHPTARHRADLLGVEVAVEGGVQLLGQLGAQIADVILAPKTCLWRLDGADGVFRGEDWCGRV
jgi:hypothetical protein